MLHLDVGNRLAGGVVCRDSVGLVLDGLDGGIRIGDRSVRVDSRGRCMLMLQSVGGGFRVDVRSVSMVGGRVVVSDRVCKCVRGVCSCVLDRIVTLLLVLGVVWCGVRVVVVSCMGMVRTLFLVHADGVLGLVDQRLAATRVGVLLARSLVLHGLASGLLGVGDDVTLGLVTHASEVVADLVGGGLGVVGGNLVTDLVGKVLAAGVSHGFG